MKEYLKIRPYLCAAYVRMNVSRFTHIYVQDMNKCLQIRQYLCAGYE